MPTASRPRPSGLAIGAALLTVYVVWGSTYLGIAVAIETLPPFLMLGTRFALAGLLLFGLEMLTTRREFTWPSRRQWRDAALVGVLLIGGGNGMVGWSEQMVPSGIAATLIALVPVWLVVFGRVYFGDRLPRPVALGVVIGFAGVALLVWPFGDGSNSFALAGIAGLIVAPISWAHGSLFAAKSADLPRRPLTNTAVQALGGSVVLLLAGVVLGEPARVDLGSVTVRSLAAVAYLTFIGTMVAYSAYAWLLRNAPVSIVGTYAYVNPVVAVALGAVILSEPITPRTLVASAVIIGAVAIIVTARSRHRRASVPQTATEDAGSPAGPTSMMARSATEAG